MLGHSPQGAAGWPHPVTISVHPRGKTSLIDFSLGGPPIVNVGGQRSVSQVILHGELDETYAEEFDACEARWLVPHLARLAAGEEIPGDVLVAGYVSRFGHPPTIEWSADYTF